MVNNDKKHLKNISKKQFKGQSAVTKKARSVFSLIINSPQHDSDDIESIRFALN